MVLNIIKESTHIIKTKEMQKILRQLAMTPNRGAFKVNPFIKTTSRKVPWHFRSSHNMVKEMGDQILTHVPGAGSLGMVMESIHTIKTKKRLNILIQPTMTSIHEASKVSPFTRTTYRKVP
jgi:hypothetical protein